MEVERQESGEAPSLKLLNVWKDKMASERVEKVIERGSGHVPGSRGFYG